MLKINLGPVLEENRELTPLPKFTFSKEFSAKFNDYFSDHFGFRNYFVTTDRWLRYQIFKVSPNKAITIGKDNWLFYTPDVQYIDSVNAQPFNQDDLNQIKNNLKTVQDNFEKQNIKFYFLVAPNKQSIYPEYLPSYMEKIRADSRLDQLSIFLEKDKKINFVNPKNELIAANKENMVYLKYDTHWNELGAFVAYQKLFSRIGEDLKNVKAKTINDFMVSQKESPNNDLAKQIGMERIFKEAGPVFKNQNTQAKTVFENCPKIYTNCPLIIQETTNFKLPKLVMFRDSFGINLIPFISEHFQRSYYFWGPVPFSMNIIDSEKPNIVIFELTEREIWRLKDKLFDF